MSACLRSLPELLDQDLVCVDLETTGAGAAIHRIIEIGLVTIDRDGALGEWSTLVNPETSIPPSIVAFTGIDNAMVAQAPRFADVYQELLRHLGGRLFVAHNARFDYGFIKSELRRLQVRFQARTLCTVKLSRRLYPEHARHNLDALIERHRLGCEARHRALGDARALRDLLAVYAREVEPTRLAEAARTVLNEVALPPQLPSDLAEELPESPGVYRFYGEADALLYVGKSKNLKARVLAHFALSNREARNERLKREVRRVEWQETAGELGALLREARAVKTLKPLYNRRLREAGETFTMRLVAPTPGAPLKVLIEAHDEIEIGAQAELFGLFRRAHDARQALTEIARARGLCLKVLGLEAGAGSCFAFQLGRCRGACTGAEPVALHDTRLRLALAPSRLKAWPFRGRIAVRERDWSGQTDLHVFDAWRYLGTVHEEDALFTLTDPGLGFDPDVYRLLSRYLSGAAAGAVIRVEPCRAE